MRGNSSANATTASLTGGGMQVSFGAGASLVNSFTILHTTTANGLGGTTFTGGLSGTAPAGFSASLSYLNNQDVLLNLNGQLAGPGSLPTLAQNPQNVANAINNFFNNGGALPPSFVALFGLSGGNLATALTLLSGETTTGAQQGAFQLGGQFLDLMLDPFTDGRAGGGGAGGATGFAPEREALPEDIALAYARIPQGPTLPCPARRIRAALERLGIGLWGIQPHEGRSAQRREP